MEAKNPQNHLKLDIRTHLTSTMDMEPLSLHILTHCCLIIPQVTPVAQTLKALLRTQLIHFPLSQLSAFHLKNTTTAMQTTKIINKLKLVKSKTASLVNLVDLNGQEIVTTKSSSVLLGSMFLKEKEATTKSLVLKRMMKFTVVLVTIDFSETVVMTNSTQVQRTKSISFLEVLEMINFLVIMEFKNFSVALVTIELKLVRVLISPVVEMVTI